MPRAGLTPVRVVEEAEALADEVGIAQVTLAAIAERLGVRVPSLYKHINGLDALHRLIETRAKLELADVLARATVGRSRDDALDAMAHAVRVWAKAHPGRYETTVRAPEPGDSAGIEASGRAVQVMFDALAGYGLTGDDAIDATRNFRASIHGFVALEAAGGFGLPRDVDRSFDRVVAGLRLSLSQWAGLAA